MHRRLWAGIPGAALCGLAGYLTWRNLQHERLDGLIFWVPVTLWLLTMGLLWWWTALGGPGTGARIEASWRIGWIFGAVGLGAGFVGPLLVTPGASLGPLLGILITGPGGFILGALVGALVGPRMSGEIRSSGAPLPPGPRTDSRPR